ncbi:MAG: hypothetical protein GTO55_09860 [Armatimonadetes bacterium]|nr:hypothetical protein [Armatimonadota bacterium]NIM24548.1 hypothetical protein [Armatimonadota bacterium]NIM68422.1 hypothetical protein [Armatimonadota bacterium]NIM76808.1 hypothetical protein [Armatimonadota bacterium]NIN06621.1 hypothetical protein [Armatimonadota bacterium]
MSLRFLSYFGAGFLGAIVGGLAPWFLVAVAGSQSLSALPIRILIGLIPAMEDFGWDNLTINWIAWILIGALGGILCCYLILRLRRP